MWSRDAAWLPFDRSKGMRLDGVVATFRWNRNRMRYQENLRDGLTIASGSVEGAGRSLVKDRMKRSGMHCMLFVHAAGGALPRFRLSTSDFRLHP